MVRDVTVRRVGGSVGATLPKELAARFQIEPGDRLLAIETADGILLTPYDTTTEEALAIAGRAARRYRHALRELAR
jgi:putative addiction module antidote